REDDMEVADRQEIGLLGLQPCACRRALAPWTVPVATGVVGDPLMPAVGTGFDVTAQSSSATGLDRRHHLELAEAQVYGMGGAIGRAGRAKDIGNLDSGAHWLRRVEACPPSGPSAGRGDWQPPGSYGSRPWCRAQSSQAWS